MVDGHHKLSFCVDTSTYIIDIILSILHVSVYCKLFARNLHILEKVIIVELFSLIDGSVQNGKKAGGYYRHGNSKCPGS